MSCFISFRIIWKNQFCTDLEPTFDSKTKTEVKLKPNLALVISLN
jgi:hypothetical protein